MTQAIILRYLSDFFKDNKNTQLAIIKNDQAKNEYIKHIDLLIEQLSDEGICFGLSLVHAIKKDGALLEWWEQALKDIANNGTDFDIAKFKSLTKLPKDLSYLKQPSDILTYVAIAIVNAQASGTGVMHSIFPEMWQDNILKPNSHIIDVPESKTESSYTIRKSYLEVASDQGIKIVKYHKIIAGNLPEECLNSDLDEKSFDDVMTFVHNPGHTIRIASQKTDWLFYDPNDDHRKKEDETIYQIMPRALCVKKIISTLETSIAIEVASYDEKTNIEFKAYDRLVIESPLTLIKGYGLWVMARYSPAILEGILQHMPSSEQHKFARVIAESLLLEKFENTSFAIIAQHAPDALLSIICLVDASKEGRQLFSAIVRALEKTTESQWTGLHIIARYAPAALLKLLTVHLDNQDLVVTITRTLAARTIGHWTCFEFITYYCRDALSILLKKIDDLCLAKVFCANGDHGYNGMYAMATRSPHFLTFIEIALKFQGLQKTLEAVFNKTKEDVTTWGMLDKITQNKIIEYIAKEFVKPHQYHQESWQLFCRVKPKRKNQLLEEIKKNLETMEHAMLTEYHNKLRQTYYIRKTTYSAICNKDYLLNTTTIPLFFWQVMVSMVNDVLRTREQQKAHNSSQQLIPSLTHPF